MPREDDLHIIVQSDVQPLIGKTYVSGRECWLIKGPDHKSVAELFVKWWEEQDG